MPFCRSVVLMPSTVIRMCRSASPLSMYAFIHKQQHTGVQIGINDTQQPGQHESADIRCLFNDRK